MQPTIYKTSPFEGYEIQNKQTVIDNCNNLNIALPPTGGQHFLSHLNEMHPFAIDKAFALLDQKGVCAGVHTFQIDNPYLAVTRLFGPKLGQDSLESEERLMHYRGEDRPKQPVVIREDPFQRTSLITLIVFPNDDAQLTLWTMHSGPAMDPDLNHVDWTHNALAFTQEEVNNASFS
jgi:hypothetical protein